MRYLSVCSGIEAATVAWEPLGFEAVAFSDIEPFPCALLEHYYDAPNLGDMERHEGWQLADVDLLVGGTPCQSFSVAGLRKGMADPRGNLALVYLAIADQFRPRWLVWENVPGVLSSNGGRDFGAFLGGLGQLGYGWAYRVLDAQYFGVPQRRRRVFVVGHLGSWQRAAAVLFERASLSGNPPPRREAGARVVASLTRGADSSGKGGYAGRRQEDDINIVASTGDIAHCLNAGGMGRQDYETETMIAHTLTVGTLRANSGRNQIEGPYVPEISNPVQANEARTYCNAGNNPRLHNVVACFDETQITHPENRSLARPDSANLSASARPPAVAFDMRGRDGGSQFEGPHDTANIRSSNGGSSRSYVASSAVRRLTPRECERLQGFPDVREMVTLQVWREAEKRDHARSAALHSAAQSHAPSVPVAVHALIDSERKLVQLHSHGRLLWSASDAELSGSSPLPMPLGDFVRLAAHTNRTLAQAIRAGRAVSPLNISGSSRPLNGSVLVHLSGTEIAALASDAERFTSALHECSRFITSGAGPSSPHFASILETSCSCVAAAIATFIPAEIRLASSYALSVEVVTPYTLIPYRGKPASDSVRYRALGNSMAVPVMRWIGERIAAVEAIQ